jgi:uncharacterized metal-binding protein YceD (DUF177 family)
MLKVNILNLNEGENNLDYVLSAADFELEKDLFKNNININITLVKSLSQLAVNINFETMIRFVCDRCLDDFDFLCKGNLDLYFKPMPARNRAMGEIPEDDNIRFYSVENKYIDITNDVRDFILLSVPMRHVPEEIDGVCIVCKKNFDELIKSKNLQEAINPVWKKLLDKDN